MLKTAQQATGANVISQPVLIHQDVKILVRANHLTKKAGY